MGDSRLARIAKLSGAVLVFVLVAALFILSCVATASDGQGAVVFLFSLPISVFLWALGFYLASTFRRSEPADFPLLIKEESGGHRSVVRSSGK